MKFSKPIIAMSLLALCFTMNAHAEGEATDAFKGCVAVGGALAAGITLGELYHKKLPKPAEIAVIGGSGCLGGTVTGLVIGHAQAAEAPSAEQLNKEEPAQGDEE